MPRFGLAFCLTAAVFITWGRWHAIVYPLALYPDEAQFASSAMRVPFDGFSWNAIDNGTSGPLNSIILCWPYLLGGDVTLSTTRLTALALLCSIVVFVYLTLEAVGGRLPATVLTSPIASFYGWTTDPEFLHFSGELLPLSLLSFANWLAIRAYVQSGPAIPSHRLTVAVGLAIGVAPLAKLQSAPLALVLALFVLFVLLRRSDSSRRITVAVFMLSCLAPALALLVPLALTGTLHDFLDSYVIASTLYAEQGDAPVKGHLLPFLLSADVALAAVTKFLVFIGVIAFLVQLTRNAWQRGRIARISMLVLDVLAGAAVFLATNIALPLGILASLCALAADRNPESSGLRLYSLAMFGAAAFAITAPGRPFPHYAMLLLPSLALLAGVGFPVGQGEGRAQPGVAVLCLLTAVAALPPLAESLMAIGAPQTSASSALGDPGTLGRFSFDWRAPRVYDWVATPRDRLLVWGWMPQWYLWSGLVPASRETVTYRQIRPSRLRDYYRTRLLADIARTPPQIIVDSVVGWSLGRDWIGDSGIATFPQLESIVRAGYEKLPGTPRRPDGCPDVYVSKATMTALKARLVRFASIAAVGSPTPPLSAFGPQHVDDNSVTEDSCRDYWLLPEGQLGGLRIAFTRLEAVARILILNTHGGPALDRSTRRVRLNLYRSGQTVRMLEVDLQSHPKWTEVELDRPWLSDALGIDILSFDGRGAGLNEVKVFRN